MEEIIQMFPSPLKRALGTCLQNNRAGIEEIRLRIGQDIEIVYADQHIWIKQTTITKAHLQHLLAQMTSHSLYRYDEQLKKGYFTIFGGHRVGVSGHIVMKEQTIHHMTNIVFMNIRIAKAVQAKNMQFIPYLHEQNKWKNCCIVGAPQTGKTTLLRYIARVISDGSTTMNGQKVLIIDERSEIAHLHEEGTIFPVGKRTDVLDNCPKHIGMMMGIRSMSPHVIIVDEIGSNSDVQAIYEAVYAGVQIICTIHAEQLSDLFHKDSLKPLLDSEAFERFIVLERQNDIVHVKIYNQQFQLIGQERNYFQ